MFTASGKQYNTLWINEKSARPSSVTVDRKHMTHSQETIEHFNNYFTSVGKELQRVTSYQLETISKTM